MAIRKVGVVGCGLMGGGVAQTCAQSGYETVVSEVNQPLLDKGLTRIYDAWDSLTKKGKLSQGQVDEYRGRLRGTLDHADFADCDLVIEAVIENMEEKLRLFPALDHIVKPEGLLLSNTSRMRSCTSVSGAYPALRRSVTLMRWKPYGVETTPLSWPGASAKACFSNASSIFFDGDIACGHMRLDQ